MNALVYAAGLGTRLAPLTNELPKALVEVGGLTMLERVIGRLRDAGVRKVVVNVHHHADKVKSFVNEHYMGMEIAVSDESNLLLDTGGGLLKARTLLDDGEPFIIHNADVLTDFPLELLVNEHSKRGNKATLLVSQRNSSRLLHFSKATSELVGWENVKTGEKLLSPNTLDGVNAFARAFCGISILEPSLFSKLEAYHEEIGKDVFPIVPFFLYAGGEGRGIRSLDLPKTNRWHDIGTLERLEKARADFSA